MQLWQGQAGSAAAANFGGTAATPSNATLEPDAVREVAWRVAVSSLMSVSERSSKGTVLENNPQSITSHRCSTPRLCGVCAMQLCSCMSVSAPDRRTGPIQFCMSGPVLQVSDTQCMSGLLGCPSICHSVARLPVALDSLWHICTEHKPAAQSWALLPSTGAWLPRARQHSNLAERFYIWTDVTV